MNTNGLGLESELQWNEIVVCLHLVSTLAFFPLIFGSEFRIGVVGGDNGAIIRCGVAMRVVCVLSEQDALVAAHAEHHQRHQHVQHGSQNQSPSRSYFLPKYCRTSMAPLRSHLRRAVEQMVALGGRCCSRRALGI